MPDLIHVEYKQSGNSINTNELGMRDMQARAYEKRNSQYLLIKSPPASGKSRALMFLALDKLENQNIRKVIVTVPETTIGSSFAKTDLKEHGFFKDWEPNDEFNLCTSGSDKSKIKAFKDFMKCDEEVLICTHATFRFACDEIEEELFNDCLIALDEFHHVSANVDNRIGEVLRLIMNKSSAHIVAMTGSYFRGDSVPILLPKDEEKFTKVKYDYYEQLNGYKYLKSLGIGYHFYQGRYTDAILEVLDTNKKTIIHIPHPNSGESTGRKNDEVGFILDEIGEVIKQDPDTGIIHIKRKEDNKEIKVANLVDDSPRRILIVNYLRTMNSIDDLDLIIAVGMAKEGFDWPYCEHTLTVGYRGSLTEVIQIIGRCTRDSDNKTHAQFTNLIAQPDVKNDEVKVAVNNMLKAITASLLMEQVLAPNFKFKTKLSNEDISQGDTIKIKGFKEPSDKVKNILESDMSDLKAAILQDPIMIKAMPGNLPAEEISKVIIPKILKRKLPDLDDLEIETVRQHLMADSAIKNGEIKEVEDKRFIRMAGQFVNIDDLDIDMIDKVNPFQKAYEILSKSVTKKVLRTIRDTIASTRIEMTDDQAIYYWPKVNEFVNTFNRKPEVNSEDPLEKRLAETIIYLKAKKRSLNSDEQK